MSAVLFLSSPHRGTNLARILNRFLGASMIASSKDYINEIERNSTTLEQLNEDFRNFASRLDLYSFYESKETSVLTNVTSIPGLTTLTSMVTLHSICRKSPFSCSCDADGLGKGLIYLGI